VKEVYIVVKGVVRTAENTCVGPNQLLVPHPSLEAMAETDLLLLEFSITDIKELQETYPEIAMLLQEQASPFREVTAHK